MPTLYLLRHAKSSWDDPSLADIDRPLSARGAQAAAALTSYLEDAAIAPAIVLCSPASRALQTLEAIRPALGDPAQVLVEPTLYEASAGDLLHRLRGVPSGTPSLMLIGHNPAIAELALGLARAGSLVERLRGKFPTGALATLSVPEPWATLAGGAGELEALVVPADLSPGR